MAAYLETKDLTVGYHGKPLIEDVSLHVQRGKIVTLIGPNGSGKSTILKTIIGQLSKVSGTVFLDGKAMEARSRNEIARRMAILMTARMEPELMTCRDVVSSGRYPYTGKLGILTSEDRAIVERSLAQVGGLDFADRLFANISDGQRQRILLARALCQEPEIIVLDEPTSFLDIRYKLELLMNQAGLTMGAREVEKQAHARSEATGGAPAAAIELSDGTVITGKTGPLLGATASALINALKYLAGIPQETDLVSATAIEPIQTLKTNYLGGKNPRLHTDEILIALSSSAASSELAAAAMHQLPNLKGCDVHSTVLLSSVDSSTLNRLGMYLTCDPVYEEEDRKYHKL